MKKIHLLTTMLVFALLSGNLRAAVTFTGIPDSTAIVGDSYTYTVLASITGAAPVTYTLKDKRPGMTISGSVISWVPANANDAGMVTIKATQGAQAYYQTFYIYVAESVVCDANMVSYFKFNETSGSTVVDFAGANNGTTASPAKTTFSAGKVGGAVNLAATTTADNFITLPSGNLYDFERTDPFSVGYWFKLAGAIGSSTSDQIVFALQNADGFIKTNMAFGFNYSEAGNIRPKFNLTANNHDAALNYIHTVDQSVPENVWQHISFVYVPGSLENNNMIKVYINGVFVVEYSVFAYNGSTFYPGYLATIGHYSIQGGGISNSFKGSLDDLFIYKKALSAAEVSSIYNEGNKGEQICKANSHAPVIVASLADSTNEDAPFSDKILARDIEGNPITFAVITKPAWLTISSNGTVTGTPTNSEVGSHQIEVSATDGTYTVKQAFTLVVKNVNDAPVITPGAPTAINEDVAYSYTLQFSDVDAGDIHTFSTGAGFPSWLTFNPGTGVLSGTPTNDQVGFDATKDYPITLIVKDKKLATDEESFTLTVTNVNDAPTIDGQDVININEDTDREITKADITITDVDNMVEDLVLTVKAGTNYTFSGNTITPDENFNGELTVPVQVSDGDKTTAIFNLKVTVLSVNDLPTFTNEPATKIAKQGATWDWEITVADVDDNASSLTIAADTIPAWLQLKAGDYLVGTPDFADIGTHRVAISVTDGKGKTYYGFDLVVEKTNETPIITSSAITVGDDYEIYTYTIVATDGDGDNLVYSVKTKPSWLSFDVASHVLSGTPKYNNTGDNNVVLSVTDGFETVDQTFTIVVGNTNSLPEFTSTPLTSIKVGEAYVYKALVSDLDEDDILTIECTKKPDWMTFTQEIKDGQVSGLLAFVAQVSNVGDHEVVLKVSDGKGGTDEQVFTVKVSNKTSIFGVEKSSLVSKIYPIPASDQLHLELSNTIDDLQFTIMDLTGKIVFSEDIANSSGLVTIDISHLNSGLYIYKIIQYKTSETGKFQIK